jgi:hypothetical protein
MTNLAPASLPLAPVQPAEPCASFLSPIPANGIPGGAMFIGWWIFWPIGRN